MRLGRIKLAFRADGRPIAVVIPPIMIVLYLTAATIPAAGVFVGGQVLGLAAPVVGRVARSLDRLGRPGVPPAPHRSAGAERTGSGA